MEDKKKIQEDMERIYKIVTRLDSLHYVVEGSRAAINNNAGRMRLFIMENIERMEIILDTVEPFLREISSIGREAEKRYREMNNLHNEMNHMIESETTKLKEKLTDEYREKWTVLGGTW